MRCARRDASKLMIGWHDPVMQLTCRDRNRIAMQSDLMGAHILGIRNILCLTGDYPTVGDHKEAKPVYDLDSVQVMQLVTGLNNGKDYAGNKLDGATAFTIGGAVTPEADPLGPMLVKFEVKVRAGAEFFQTQAVFINESTHAGVVSLPRSLWELLIPT